jgi:hypothetical protein
MPEQAKEGGWHSDRFVHTLAAIDLGTNNCRLLVARASVDGFEVIDAYSRPVRLGEGVALSGTLCGDASTGAGRLRPRSAGTASLAVATSPPKPASSCSWSSLHPDGRSSRPSMLPQERSPTDEKEGPYMASGSGARRAAPVGFFGLHVAVRRAHRAPRTTARARCDSGSPGGFGFRINVPNLNAIHSR